MENIYISCVIFILNETKRKIKNNEIYFNKQQSNIWIKNNIHTGVCIMLQVNFSIKICNSLIVLYLFFGEECSFFFRQKEWNVLLFF